MQTASPRAPQDPAPPGLRIVEESAGARVQPGRNDVRFGVILAAILGVAALIRIGFIVASDFPLNDGGMFFQMVRDLQANGYRLPESTTYNDLSIPFAYPPVGFYLAAALDDLTPMSLTTVFRVMPLACSLALLGACWLLVRALLPTRTHAIVALLVFCTLPATFQWMLMGGGVTRAPGFVLALLAITMVHRALAEPTRLRIGIAGVLAGAALMTHLEMGVVVAYSSLLLFLFQARDRRGLAITTAIGFIAVITVLPWLIAVTSMHGVAPYVAAAQTGSNFLLEPIVLLLQYDPTLEALFPLSAMLALLGAIKLICRRQYLLPCWFVATAFLDPRAFPTSVSFVVAMLAAYGVMDVVWPLMRRLGSLDRGESPSIAPAPAWLAGGAAVIGVLYLGLGTIMTSPGLLTGMTADERSAMAWVRDNTPPDADFVVVSGDRWAVDRTAEWFPVLAERQSVGTVQGYEWLPAGSFADQVDRYKDLQLCANDSGDCLRGWELESGHTFAYVYVPKLARTHLRTREDTCCMALRGLLKTDPGFRLIYDGAGATIFQRVETAARR